MIQEEKMVGASGFEPPTSWPRTNHVNPITLYFGVAYGIRSVISPLLVVPNLYLDRFRVESRSQHQSCFAQAVLDCAFQLGKNPVLSEGGGAPVPKRLERLNVTAVVDVEILLSAHWRALPPRHCSVSHYAERRHDSGPDSCRLSCLVS